MDVHLVHEASDHEIMSCQASMAIVWAVGADFITWLAMAPPTSPTRTHMRFPLLSGSSTFLMDE